MAPKSTWPAAQDAWLKKMYEDELHPNCINYSTWKPGEPFPVDNIDSKWSEARWNNFYNQFKSEIDVRITEIHGCLEANST